MPGVIKDTPIGFHRLFNTPLDDSVVISNGNAGLFDYINNKTAYLGQRLLVRYDHFDLNVVLQHTSSGSGLIPVFEMPTGYELIFKDYNNSKYVLVYYYNKGALFTNRAQVYRVSDPFAMSLLYQMSLFANSDTNINYLLEADSSVYTFSHANFVTNTVALNSGDNGLVKISSTANNNFFFTTRESSIGIMPKTASNKLVRLWVKANDYYNAVYGA